jgi:quinoprotein glucose dehydrogenase
MEALAEWSAPGPREPVQGHVIIIDPASRDQAAWKRTLTNRLPSLVTNAPDEAVRDKARELAAKAGIALDSAAALRTALDAKADSSERIACLKQLEQEGGAPLDQAVRAALASSDPALRAAARDALARRDPTAALPLLRAALNDGSVPERQAAIRSLASIQSPEADTELATLATSLLDGSLAPALQLDVSEAYLSRASKENPVAAWKAAQSSADPLAPFMICIEGGDAERGRRVLNGHAGAQCLRCHALAGGGGHAAPSLEGVARRYDRKGLLESLIVPNAKIAPGFGPTSAMPTMSVLLTPREIRDVVAYLSTLQ